MGWNSGHPIFFWGSISFSSISYQLAEILLHYILKGREAGEGSEVLRSQVLNEVIDGVAEGIDGQMGCDGTVGQLPFKGLPEAFDRIELGTVGRRIDQRDIRRRGDSAGAMGGRVVENQDVEAGGVVLAEVLQEQLKASRIHGGRLQPKSGAGGGLDGGVEPEVMVQESHHLDGFDSARGDALSGRQMQADSGFVRTPQPYRCGRIVRA